ncbi:MAG: DMT family transporter [Maricaulaceae bacterium]|nr:DMT family transporter [Maricaulaceae bacterium]
MTAPAAPAWKDWAGLLFLALIWGGAFALIEVAIEGASPGGVAFGRLALGAVMLGVYAKMRGHRFPPLTDARWLWLLALGFMGNALPFYLTPLGQQSIDSALAGILMAVMPLATVALAHVFANEKMTARGLTGFLVGFAGVVILMGPAALRDLGGPAFLGQLAVLGAALAYAVNVIIARRTPPMPASIAAAGMLIGGALLSAPLGIAEFIAAGARFDAAAWGAVALLGVGPTAIASVIYIRIIASAGAGFMAMINYLVPVVAVITGVAVMGERPEASALAGFAVILAGLFIARGGKKPPPAPVPPQRNGQP